MDSAYKAILYGDVRLFLGKVRVQLFEVWAELAHFCMEHIFTWNNNWDELWLLQLGYLAGIFLQMSKVSLSLQGKLLVMFVTNQKNWTFQVRIQILENLNLLLWASKIPKS